MALDPRFRLRAQRYGGLKPAGARGASEGLVAGMSERTGERDPARLRSEALSTVVTSAL